MAFGFCNPSGRWDEVLGHESEDVVTNLLEFSFHFRDVFPRVPPATCSPALFVVCNLFLSVSNLGCGLNFLLSLDNLLDLNLHLMFLVLRGPSLQSSWLLQRSVTVCCSFCCFCVTPFHTSSVFVLLLFKKSFFSTRQLSTLQLQSPLQSRLGVLLLSRQPSILALLKCVDDFQYPCLSSSVQLLSSRHSSPRTFRSAVGTALLFF